MRSVYQTTELAEAEFIRAALRHGGIESALENEGGAMYGVGIPSAAVPLIISVSDEDAERAAAVVKRILADRRERKKNRE